MLISTLVMEVENFTETTNLKETPLCLSTNIGKDFKSNSEGCKLSFEMNTNSSDISLPNHRAIDDQTSHSNKSLVLSADSISELPRNCQEVVDETKTFPKMAETVYRSQVIRDNLKAISERYGTHFTQLLNSNLGEDLDEIGQPGGQVSPKADVSPNEDSSEAPTAEVSDDSSHFDARRTRRKSKRKLDGDFCCPVCGLTVREPELVSHFAQEVEKLAKIPGNMMKLRQRKNDGINTTYVQVKSNRENRLTAKVAKYAAKANKEVQCPICKLRISGSEEEVNKHVILCVVQDDYDEHIVVDDDEEDDESFEEYEFADQTRIRPISLVSGGYRSLEGPTSKRIRSDENEDLDVDVDDTMAFGDPQYTEFDVITNSADGDSTELRKAVIGNQTAQPHVLESRKWGDIAGANERQSLSDSPTEQLPNNNSRDESKTDENKSDEKIGVCDQTVTSLKEKIKDLEDQNRSVKCLICMESYTKPVVSTTCWHVHCEECWLMTMGVKKLCPQCNMIVFPSDLRKIYL